MTEIRLQVEKDNETLPVIKNKQNQRPSNLLPLPNINKQILF